LTGVLGGAEYKIRVPANWNGTLLVFAHGTQVFESGVPEIAPVAWPLTSPSLEEELLTLGYALAGSGYQNSPKDGVQRTLALTSFFNGAVGRPVRTIIWGNSLGGSVALKLIEEHHGIYDAAIANCAATAGRAENMDATLAFGLAYAAAFGWNDAAWGPIEDLRDDLDFFAEVRPMMQFPNESNFGRWEFIRFVMRLPAPAFWGTDPLTTGFFFGLGLWRATGQRAAAESENGGPVAENIGFEYTLTASEKEYLSSLGVDADGLLAFMNARANIAAKRSARKHLEQWGGVSGWLARPVLTMHSIYDGLVPVYNESAYANAVTAAGSSGRLVQAYVTDVGHCSFSKEQYLSVLAAMQHWLNTGVKPDISAFPTSQGFDLEYVPPPWPFF
jgi:pimeloyl-ACP methyl ester carboxylesterase